MTLANGAPANPSSTAAGRVWLWALLALLGMFAFMAVAIAAIGWIGFKIFTEQALTAIRADPAVVAAVGQVHDIELDFNSTFQAPGSDEFGYRIDGELADGLLIGHFVTIDADHEELRAGTLTLNNGTVVAVGTVQQRVVDPRRAESPAEVEDDND